LTIFSYEEFSLFEILLHKPDFDYDIAFMMFDTNKDGFISKTDFDAAMASLAKAKNFNFDVNCNLVKRFFGPNGDKSLRFHDFSQFFNSLQTEITKQQFQKKETAFGFVPGEEFVDLMTSSGRWHIPDGVIERLNALKAVEQGGFKGRSVSFSEFLAYDNVFNRLAGIRATIDFASKRTRNGTITKGQGGGGCC
jgi:solute carrier family 25 (mitochondrial aspartate/glutamate transporter), member 12/13